MTARQVWWRQFTQKKLIMSQRVTFSSYIPHEKILWVTLIKTRFCLVFGYYFQSRSEDLIGGLMSNESFVRKKTIKLSIIHHLPPTLCMLLRMQPMRLVSAIRQSISHFSNIEFKVIADFVNVMQVWIKGKSDFSHFSMSLLQLSFPLEATEKQLPSQSSRIMMWRKKMKVVKVIDRNLPALAEGHAFFLAQQ